ncbi:hypothetical protein CN918_30300 [Priestia megaterium]|nr:hypothetical protein CN918_30300 [Priestia megaterium]
MNSVSSQSVIYEHEVVVKPKKNKGNTEYTTLLFTHKLEEMPVFTESVEETYQIAKESKRLAGESKGKMNILSPLIILTRKEKNKETIFLVKEESCQYLASKYGSTVKSLRADIQFSATFAENIYQSAKEEGLIICEHTVKVS